MYINNSWICLLGRAESDLIRSKHVALIKYTIFVYQQSVVCINNSWICLLGGPENDLVRSKHVALTKYTLFVYK